MISEKWYIPFSFVIQWIQNCSNSSQVTQRHHLCFVMVVFRWTSGFFFTFLQFLHRDFQIFYCIRLGFFFLCILMISTGHPFGGCLRGNWEVSRRDQHNSQFIAMVAADRNFLDSDFDDYPAPTSRSLICCRMVAIIVISLSLSLSFWVFSSLQKSPQERFFYLWASETIYSEIEIGLEAHCQRCREWNNIDILI